MRDVVEFLRGKLVFRPVKGGMRVTSLVTYGPGIRAGSGPDAVAALEDLYSVVDKEAPRA